MATEVDDFHSTENQPPPGSSDGSQHAGAGVMENGESNSTTNDVARSIKARKRTKTGCLSMFLILPKHFYAY